MSNRSDYLTKRRSRLPTLRHCVRPPQLGRPPKNRERCRTNHAEIGIRLEGGHTDISSGLGAGMRVKTPLPADVEPSVNGSRFDLSAHRALTLTESPKHCFDISYSGALFHVFFVTCLLFSLFSELQSGTCRCPISWLHARLSVAFSPKIGNPTALFYSDGGFTPITTQLSVGLNSSE